MMENFSILSNVTSDAIIDEIEELQKLNKAEIIE